MTLHHALDDNARDRAALYALGSLPPVEAGPFEAHLNGCALCRDEVGAMREVVSDLALLAPEAEPSAPLRARLLERIRAERAGSAVPSPPRSPASERAKRDRAGEGFSFARAAEGSWESTSWKGIETRRLFVDASNDRVTMLIRMSPGATYPPHIHRGPEECYVIEGDLLSGDAKMKTGDYKRAEPGSRDGVQSTRDGCLLLVVSSMHDEVIEEAAG